MLMFQDTTEGRVRAYATLPAKDATPAWMSLRGCHGDDAGSGNKKRQKQTARSRNDCGPGGEAGGGGESCLRHVK